MKTVAIIAVAAALFANTAPAFAKVQGRYGDARISLNEKTGKYCLKQKMPGSLASHSICRTAVQWADAGLTITHKPAVQLAQR